MGSSKQGWLPVIVGPFLVKGPHPVGRSFLKPEKRADDLLTLMDPCIEQRRNQNSSYIFQNTPPLN